MKVNNNTPTFIHYKTANKEVKINFDQLQKFVQDKAQEIKNDDFTFIKKFSNYLQISDKNNDKIIENSEIMNAIKLYVQSFYPGKIIYNGPYNEEKSLEIYMNNLVDFCKKYGVSIKIMNS
ncbi:MAG: hypothetical protein ACK4GR_01760 [bacterium]